MRVKMRLRAFTLIELLVVISIIAILISIMVPALASSRKRALHVVCTTHLKDIGYAMNMYAMDYDDKFPDRDTLGGFPFRATPGYRDPEDRRGLPEKYGLAAVLGANNCIEANSEIWVCKAQPLLWMKDLGNTYAFSIAAMLKTTKTSTMKRMRTTWLVWDNYQYYPYTPGFLANGSEAGFAIPLEERKIPHSFGRGLNTSKAINVLYADCHVEQQLDQSK